MRYFSALWALMYRFSANSRATISSTAIFLSQQSRQYFSSPRGSDTSFALHSAHRDCATDLRGIALFYQVQAGAGAGRPPAPTLLASASRTPAGRSGPVVMLFRCAFAGVEGRRVHPVD